MIIPTSIDLHHPPTAELPQSLDLPPARHLVHASGCPLYVWWSLGKQRNRAGQHWRCWFLYLEYRLADGGSAYVQQTLNLNQLDDPALWQRLAQISLPGACPHASRQQLIRG